MPFGQKQHSQYHYADEIDGMMDETTAATPPKELPNQEQFSPIPTYEFAQIILEDLLKLNDPPQQLRAEDPSD